MNMPEPKLFNSLPDESNLRTGARVEPAQLSYANGEAPGGMSGFAPHRSATQTDSPSLSIATPFRAPHFLPSGSFPHGAMVWYGLGRSLAGWISPAGVAQAPHSVIAALVASGSNLNRHADSIYFPSSWPKRSIEPPHPETILRASRHQFPAPSRRSTRRPRSQRDRSGAASTPRIPEVTELPIAAGSSNRRCSRHDSRATSKDRRHESRS